MKNLIASFALAVLFLSIAAIAITIPTKNKVTAPKLEFVEEIFVDYASHAGPGQHPTSESADFQLVQGGISWFSGVDVNYSITGTEAVTGGNTAIENAVETWDSFVTTRNFIRNDASPTPNPCGGNNTVQWATIDGAGNVLAAASVCRNVATKEIVGFRVKLDTDETWAIDNVTDTFDVENTASHEFGHVAGLGHDNPPRSGCLTMYKLAAEGETQKRTLGLGDKLGMDALYSTGDTTAGPGCGS